MKRSLVILHGALGSSRQFEDLAGILENDFDVHLIDFNGHAGKVPGTDFGIRSFADQLDEYMRSNDLIRPFVFGYSMGGYVALYQEARRPDSFSYIFTLATKFDWNEESSRKEAAYLDASKIIECVPHYAEFLKSLHGEIWKETLDATASMMLQLGKEPELTDELLQKIQVPCLITVGSSDRMVSAEETQKVADRIENAAFKLWEAVEHPFEKVDDDLVAGVIKQIAED